MTSAAFRIGCELSYEASGPGAFILNVSALDNAFQRIREETFRTEPDLPFQESRSSIEAKRLHRVTSGAGNLRILYSATVELSCDVLSQEQLSETPPGQLPPDIVPCLYPSRYCESDKLVRMAQREFGAWQPGFSRVTGICNWIYDNVEYLRGSTSSLTSAYDTATERAGVCRDFAHLAIAFCRALAIPARFVAGYALNLAPADFHAYFEAYLGGRWVIFDATRLSPQTSFVRIGAGRDAADTSFATIFGPVAFSGMNITMEQTGGAPAAFVTGAISTEEASAESL